MTNNFWCNSMPLSKNNWNNFLKKARKGAVNRSNAAQKKKQQQAAKNLMNEIKLWINWSKRK
jgi:hypothetical protein